MIAAHIVPRRLGTDIMATIFGKEAESEMFSSRNGENAQGAVTLDTADTIVKESQVVFLSRGMDTPLTLPNGQVVYPSTDIPPMEVHRIYFRQRHGERLAARVSALTNKCLALVTEQPEYSDIPDSLGPIDRPKGLGPILVRRLQFLAQGVHAWDLLQIDNDIGREETQQVRLREEATKDIRPLQIKQYLQFHCDVTLGNIL